MKELPTTPIEALLWLRKQEEINLNNTTDDVCAALEIIGEDAHDWCGKTWRGSGDELAVDLTPAVLQSMFEDRRGEQVLIATTGTNGNGGQLADAEDVLCSIADHTGSINGYELVDFLPEEMAQHWRDATGGELDPAGDTFACFERIHYNTSGYEIGSRDRVYFAL